MDTLKDRLYNEAFELKNANKYDEAISVFKKINSEYGEDKVATNMIAGLYYSEKNDAKNALPFAQKGIQLSPKSEAASLCLVHCLYDLGRYEEAEREIKRYLATGGVIKYYKILFDENNLTREDFDNI